jgi:hypothetical protein
MLVKNNNFRTYKSVDSAIGGSAFGGNTTPFLSCRLTRPHPLPRERTEVRGTFASIPLTLTLSQGRGDIILDTNDFDETA